MEHTIFQHHLLLNGSKFYDEERNELTTHALLGAFRSPSAKNC